MPTVVDPPARVHPDEALLAAALAYAEQGLAVLPLHWLTEDGRCSCPDADCTSIAKHPCVSWGRYRSRAASATQIKQWWSQWPDANVGIVTGRISGLVVVDVDGEEGWVALAEAGIDLQSVSTPRVRTGRGGHVYVQYPHGDDLSSRAGVLTKVDIRADNGMVVAPPSVHASGRVYAWEDGLSLADLEPAAIDLDWAVKQEGQRALGGGAEDGQWLLGVGDAIDPRVRTAANVTLAAIAEAKEGARHQDSLAPVARLAGLVNRELADEDVLLAKVEAAWRASGHAADEQKELHDLWHGARRKKFGDKQAVLTQARGDVTHAVAARLRRTGYRWLDSPYDWQQYGERRWVGRTTLGVAAAAFDIFRALGEQPSSQRVDEAVRVAQRGVCAGPPRAREAALDGSAFRLSDNQPVPGVLFDDVRVEVRPDGALQTHPHSEEVFTPQPPLASTWGDGAVAPTPLWDGLCARFRLRGEPLDPELVLRLVGAALVRDAAHHKFLALYGTAGSGKTRLIELLRLLLTPNKTFDPRDEWTLAGIETARLVTMDDVSTPNEDSLPWGWERIKGMTGQSPLAVRIKHRPSYTARFTGLFVMGGNERPTLDWYSDAAAWKRRMILLEGTPFTGTPIPDYEQVIFEREGEALLRRALRVYAAQAAKGWGDLDPQRPAVRRASRTRSRRNTKAEIRRVLRASPGLTVAEIHERIPSARRANKATVRKKVSELRAAGTVERDAERRYRLAEAGAD